MGAFISSALFSPAAVLRVVGPDSLSFLQGQFTQELRTLAAGAMTYGLWLNQKGKVLGDSHVWRVGHEEWLLVSEHFSAQALRARLDAYLIADEVELIDETSAWALEAYWQGGQPGPGCAYHGRHAATVSGGLALWSLDSEALGQPSSSVLGEPTALAAYRRERYRCLLPSIPGELGEGDLPQEAGLEAVAISFTKGCYLGQEVMARLHSMGQVRRRLVRVRGEGPPPEALKPVLSSDGKRVGEVRGALADDAGWLGLAMVLRSSLPSRESTESPTPGASPSSSGPVWSCAGRSVWLDSAP